MQLAGFMPISMVNVKQGDTSIGVFKTIGHALAGFMPISMANVKQGDTSIVPSERSARLRALCSECIALAIALWLGCGAGACM
jgi:hypothetical protein